MKTALLNQYNPSLTATDYVTLTEVPNPKIGSDSDVIVRIGGAGVCRTDLHVIEGIWREKGDAVICHPLHFSCHAIEAQRGHDMHVESCCAPALVRW